MNYSDKKQRENLFRESLDQLLIFAYARPVFSLNERRSLVMAIYNGGQLAKKAQRDTSRHFSFNYQTTRESLLKICTDKMTSHPELAADVKKAIGKVSALSVWASSNPNRTNFIFDSFVEEMCPEDSLPEPPLTIIDNIRTNLKMQMTEEERKKLGRKKYVDLVTLSLRNFRKKYGRR